MPDSLRTAAGFFRVLGMLSLIGFLILAYRAGVIHRDYIDDWELNGLVLVYAASGIIAVAQMFWAALISESVAVLLERSAPAPEPVGAKTFTVPQL